MQEIGTSDKSVKVGEGRGCDGGWVGLVRASKEARPFDGGPLAVVGLNVDVGVTADVPQDPVHAQQGPAGTDDRVVTVGKGVKKGNALALLQNLVVSRGEQAVRQTVPEKENKARNKAYHKAQVWR